jgi:hypothetical protein
MSSVALSPLFSSACRSAALSCHFTFDDRSVCPGLIGGGAVDHVQKGKQLTSKVADRSLYHQQQQAPHLLTSVSEVDDPGGILPLADAVI